MQLKTVLSVLALGILVAACGSGATRTVELDPEGVNRPATTRNQGDGGVFGLFGGSREPNAGPCPLMGVLYDNARVVQFSQPGNETYANIAYTGEVRGVRGLCRYVGDDPIRMAIEVDLAFGRGPAGAADRHTYRYWVAVTRRGVAAIEKQYFDVEASFEGDSPLADASEKIENIVIPRAAANINGDNFEILVGFDLTPEQLQFNRDGKRFRVRRAS